MSDTRKCRLWAAFVIATICRHVPPALIKSPRLKGEGADKKELSKFAPRWWGIWASRPVAS
jgi:hypothetical protein